SVAVEVRWARSARQSKGARDDLNMPLSPGLKRLKGRRSWCCGAKTLLALPHGVYGTADNIGCNGGHFIVAGGRRCPGGQWRVRGGRRRHFRSWIVQGRELDICGDQY